MYNKRRKPDFSNDEKRPNNPKTVTVDWNSRADIDKFIRAMKARFSELTPNRESKRFKHNRLMDACFKILHTDITHLYHNIPMDGRKIYYVYAHLDTSRKIAIGFNGVSTFAATFGVQFMPFYVGKGHGDRCFDINRNETHRKVRQKLNAIGKDIEVIKLFENVSEVEALAYESKLIDIFGLIPYGGILSNLDEGVLPMKRRLLYKDAFESLSLFNKGIFGEIAKRNK